MIELVIVYCLADDGRVCVEQRTPIESPLPIACLVAGQQQAQDYLRSHPKYRLAGWRCEVDLPAHGAA